ARNRGAERGGAEWIVFLDADARPVPDLLDRYLDPAPAESVGVLAGGIEDEPAEGGVARFASIAGSMRQGNTLNEGRWSYVETATRRSSRPSTRSPPGRSSWAAAYRMTRPRARLPSARPTARSRCRSRS